MNYDEYSRENKGYNSNHSYESVKKSISNAIHSQPFRDAEEERKRQRAIIYNKEKGKTSQLIELGKLCAFIEYFDKTPLSEQEIMPIGPIDNPRETESFKKGYAFAQTLISNGFSEDNYHEFEKNCEKYSNSNLKHK